ncbi:hypothetical protein PUNSTDRAFT_52938, partial [Punctularia strigosozonata HHB-11173 SS5]|uniref:uncharacterized protein n=1 Tax=Punctularia strigosozonata (strain HHB-11173) TaxID=741275 RepID=UPI0004416688
MVKSLEEYPDELLDRIIALAMAYDTVPGDPFVFTTSSAKVATDETRRNIRLVNHRWNAIAKPYMYRDIHFGWRPRVDEYETQNSDLKRFRRLCEFVSSNGPDRLTKTHTLAVFCPAEHPRTTAEMGALLCHLLSHVTLHHFAGTFDHSIPWFPYLRRSSAHTLTHLDLEIHPFIIRSSWVDHLNSMVNLKFLRLSEQRRSWVSFHQDLDEMFSSDDLPNLSLPRLTSLQLFAHYPRADMMGLEGDRIPFLLAKTAELPALTDLRLQGDFLDLGEESVIPFVAAFGSQLRTLYVQLPRGGQLRYIDLAGALPQLTHLSL